MDGQTVHTFSTTGSRKLKRGELRKKLDFFEREFIVSKNVEKRLFEISNRGKVLRSRSGENANNRDVRWRCSSNDIRRGHRSG